MIGCVFTPVQYTEEQYAVIKKMMEYSANFADQLRHIMRNHGLDKVEGCKLTIEVDPDLSFLTESVKFGRGTDLDAGFVNIVKGNHKNENFTTTGHNSPEYEYLFASEAVRSRMREILLAKDPVPADSVWLRGLNDDTALDRGVSVDVNVAEPKSGS